MNFLLSNDDGIYAKGLFQLADSLSSLGKVTIVAPHSERSATGHAITMLYPLRVKEVKLPGLDVKAYAVDGTPADCVKIGIDLLLSARPDFVFTGINCGANLGTDVLYSGTVSAAIEGCIMGVPSAAFSLVHGKEMDYTYAGQVAAEVVNLISDKGLTPNTLVNVNIPNIDSEQVKGMKVTRLGKRRYTKNYEKREDPRGGTYYWLAGEIVDEDMDDDIDMEATNNNYISITPLQYDLTDNAMLETFKMWGLQNLSDVVK
ncbi:MAG: 5'/3'-nucleotidase SurE [Clostridiales bacterium]|nr:5'/3'-nucleotidase SurE [Clostridiales bacterium]